jgi:hypothetical protein
VPSQTERIAPVWKRRALLIEITGTSPVMTSLEPSAYFFSASILAAARIEKAQVGNRARWSV